MSAEDRAATKSIYSYDDDYVPRNQMSPEMLDALIRVIRETVRAEIRAEFEGRKPQAVPQVHSLMTDYGPVEIGPEIYGAIPPLRGNLLTEQWAQRARTEAHAYYDQHGTLEGFTPCTFKDVAMVNRDLAMADSIAAKQKGPNSGRSALQQSNAYEVPETVAGVPV
jgi:hypothetical protein